MDVCEFRFSARFSFWHIKEWDLSLTYLRSLSDKLYLVPIKHQRGEDIQKVYQKAKELGFKEIHLLEERVYRILREYKLHKLRLMILARLLYGYVGEY